MSESCQAILTKIGAQNFVFIISIIISLHALKSSIVGRLINWSKILFGITLTANISNNSRKKRKKRKKVKKEG